MEVITLVEEETVREEARVLVMQGWRHELPKNARNVIISEALNACVEDKKFRILGYLITDRRVFLIGFCEDASFHEVLHYFYEKVAYGIIRYKEQLPYEDLYDYADDIRRPLFKEHPFYNEYLRRMILGEKISLKYYDPHVARMEAYVHNNNYCSLLDYLGGMSPVLVYVNYVRL